MYDFLILVEVNTAIYLGRSRVLEFLPFQLVIHRLPLVFDWFLYICSHSLGMPKWLFGHVVFGGLGYQITPFPETSGCLALPPKAARPTKHSKPPLPVCRAFAGWVEHLPGVLTPTSIRSHIGSSLPLSKPLKPRAAGRRTSMEGPPRLTVEAVHLRDLVLCELHALRATYRQNSTQLADEFQANGSKGDGSKGDGSKGDDAMGYTELAWDGDGADIVIRVTS